MTINANAMRSIALGNNVFRNIAFALANCEEELCGGNIKQFSDFSM